MISKNEAKYIQSLQQKKNRNVHQCFTVEGVKMFEELCASGYAVEKVYTTSEAIFFRAQDLFGEAKAQRVADFELEKISSLQTPNEVVAVVKMPFSAGSISDGFMIALDCIQDPGNMGTIIRLADWFGVKSIIASQDSADCYNPKTVQATMGSIFRVEMHYQDLDAFLDAKPGVPVFGALLSGKTIYECERVSKGILLIGNESKGISHALKPRVHHAITIPRKGNAESLNAAVATGIILSHLLK